MADDPSERTEVCPGCRAVLVPLADGGPAHPGASAACTRLFEVTLGGLREEAAAHAATASVVALADAAYEAQHPAPGGADRLRTALDRLGVSPGGPLTTNPPPLTTDPPPAWRTTIADVAADLDVIDLPVLVESWARAVVEDWAAVGAGRSADRGVSTSASCNDDDQFLP